MDPHVLNGTGYRGLDIVSERPFPQVGILLCVVWLLPAILYTVVDRFARQRKRTVERGEEDEPPMGAHLLTSSRVAAIKNIAKQNFGKNQEKNQEAKGAASALGITVMCAALEHSLPHLPSARAVAGGLGKVMDIVARHHPTDIIMVHPMIKQGPKVSYELGTDTAEEQPLRILVDGAKEDVRVFRQTSWPCGAEGPQVDFLLLSHPSFEERGKESIYPSPMTRRQVLCFFSLWNQCVGQLLARHRPAVFHMPDFHTAVAPWYAVPQWPSLRVLLVLHNGEYQGTISTDMITGTRLDTMAKVWNLPVEIVRRVLIHEGRFNMLHAGVQYILEHQGGCGACAVSKYYAAECKNMYSVLWGLPCVQGLDNPMLESEHAVLGEGATLSGTKAKAKREIQELYGLNVDPEARIFVSLGRLVRQKGVDLLVDTVPWLLKTYPNAQFILIGPIGDGFGHYAARKLQLIMEDKSFEGRVFAKCEFMSAPDSFKFAADFCLMPSRDEPFGYVDIEFAWRGALVVGAQAGGLGKVPGFYYVAQNKENAARMRREICHVMAQAMSAPSEALERMAIEAMECEFPLAAWQSRLMTLYADVLPGLPEQPEQPVPGRRRSSGDVEMIDARNMAPSDERRNTFRPYDTPPPPGDSGASPAARQRRSTVAEHVNMIDVNMAACGPSTFARGAKEFLTQELSEEEIADRVVDKLNAATGMDMEEILDATSADLDAERAGNQVQRFLLGKVLHIKRIHICVSAGYIATPIAVFLTNVIATEWGTRGGAHLPEWVVRRGWLAFVFATGNVDPPLLSMLLFVVASLGGLCGAPVWLRLSMVMEPRKILSLSLLLQLPLLFSILPARPNVFLAMGLVFMQGMIASVGLLFVCMNFMMSIKGDMSYAALRMGVLEIFRHCITWMFTGYIFHASPTEVQGSAEDPMSFKITWLLLPLTIVVLGMTTVPGILCLFAPGPYRDDRLPGLDLHLFWKRTSFVFLGVSDCLGALAQFPNTTYITWWFTNGWTSPELALFSAVCAVFLAVGSGAWSYSLSKASIHGSSFLVGFAVLVAPPALLRAIVFEEVATFTYLGKSYVAFGVCLFSLLLEGVRSSAMWTLKIRILNSRWRLLSYGTIFFMASSLMSAVSPFICELIARHYSSTFITSNQKELADAVIVCSVPFGIMQFTVQALGLPFISRDLGVNVQANRGRERNWWLVFRKSPIVIACSFGLFLGTVICSSKFDLINRPIPAFPVRRCSSAQLPQCKVLADETNNGGAERNERVYGKNKYGQETTGKYNCLRRMRALGGNTLMFWKGEGRCQIQLCVGPEDVLNHSSSVRYSHAGVEVWSSYCQMFGQDLVGVHLFEWPWEDIRKECTQYLGPAGFNFVQVSPVQEHIAGDSWYIRYQPVSFKIESRAGSRDEFRRMVAECREAGVSIMVDAVLNHMALNSINEKMCGQANETPTETRQKCVGFDNTEFDNREFLHASSEEGYFRRKDFHHYQGEEAGNCHLPPWANNRYLCDLFGLPDLDTESRKVQHSLQHFLMDVYSLGVTMLRIDAAAHIYPDSLAQILEPFPWDYIMLEVLPHVLQMEAKSLSLMKFNGAVTDFTYGQRVAQFLFDSYDGSTAKFLNRSGSFGEALKLGDTTDDCRYKVCGAPGESNYSVLFLDNHDQQRTRWRPDANLHNPHWPWVNPVCYWDGTRINECRPVYKHGRTYQLAMLYMLAYPYGDVVRVMSSYAFGAWRSGPPGVRNHSWFDKPTSVYAGDEHVPVRCKGTPGTSPVTVEYDTEPGTPWVCEHRWEGVAGLVRFRRLVRKDNPVTRTWDDGQGHIAFCLGEVGFVAFHRGWNNFTQAGSNETWDLRGEATTLPGGSYCNLAQGNQPVSESHGLPCPGGAPALVIDANGTILDGAVLSGAVLAVHVDYSAWDAVEVTM